MFFNKYILICFSLVFIGCSEIRTLTPTKLHVDGSLKLTPISFKNLSAWYEDNHMQAFMTFARSCKKIIKKPATGNIVPGYKVGKKIDLKKVCQKALQTNFGSSSDKARLFFETWFNLYQVSNGENKMGLFTGYYEPQLRGSRQKSKKYYVPLYRRPPDLISVGLGKFRKNWVGREISGRLRGNRLVPYPTRAAINQGVFEGKGLELLWVDNAIDAFFLHIQGSGQVILDNGEIVRLGFAGRNGQPYFAIGRDLVKRGAIAKENISLQTIRDWLEGNPKQAVNLMQKNKSYIFFRELKSMDLESTEYTGPIGASGVSLTPGRSLAVDRRYFMMGTLIWIDTTHPLTNNSLRRLMVAQDTGGAIVGSVRGDFFWGAGFDAREAAGRMRQIGQLYILLPRSII